MLPASTTFAFLMVNFQAASLSWEALTLSRNGDSDGAAKCPDVISICDQPLPSGLKHASRLRKFRSSDLLAKPSVSWTGLAVMRQISSSVFGQTLVSSLQWLQNAGRVSDFTRTLADTADPRRRSLPLRSIQRDTPSATKPE